MPDQNLEVGVQLGVTAEDQHAPVSCREVYIEHLNAGELVEHGSGSEPAGQRLEPGAQRDMEAVGEEGDEDMGFDALFQLVIDRT